GMAEAVGEARRHALDLLREGRVGDAESTLDAMEDLYAVLVTMDYPDAITGNLRRTTDIARSLIEKTRGDLAVARVSQDLHDALERHARDVGGKGEGWPSVRRRSSSGSMRSCRPSSSRTSRRRRPRSASRARTRCSRKGCSVSSAG